MGHFFRDHLCSAVQLQLEGFCEDCNPIVIILSLNLRFDLEPPDHPGEEKEDLRFRQRFPEILTLANRKWDEVFVLLAMQEPIEGPRNLSGLKTSPSPQ